MASDGRARRPAGPPVVGLVVNPVAGLGGPPGLHGSDSPQAVARALSLGARPMASARAAAALAELGEIRLLTVAGEMGATAAVLAGCQHSVIFSPASARTGAADTRRAVEAFTRSGADLILFSGGDGTARDVMRSAGAAPALGIPAGVKMHSSVFAVSPRAAGVSARAFLAGPQRPTAWREVVDVDDQWRPVLHGEMLVPADPRMLQHPKQRLDPGRQSLAFLGQALAAELQAGVTYLIGPGRTAASVLTALGLEGTLIGVDVLIDRRLTVRDGSEDDLMAALGQAASACLIVSPVGGQGFLFGRGNQQLSARVLRRIGPGRVRVAAPMVKLAGLRGRPLLIETTDAELAASFRRHLRVLTAPGREVLYPVRVEHWQPPPP